MPQTPRRDREVDHAAAGGPTRPRRRAPAPTATATPADTHTWSIRRCGDRGGMGEPLVVLPEAPARPGRRAPGPAPTRRRSGRAGAVSSGASGPRVEVADQHARPPSSRCAAPASAATWAARSSGERVVRWVAVTQSVPPSSSSMVRSALRGSPPPGSGCTSLIRIGSRESSALPYWRRLPSGPRLVDRRAPGQLHVQGAGEQQRLVDVLAAVAEVAVDLLQADDVGVGRGQQLGQPGQVVPLVVPDAVVGVEGDQPDGDRRLVGARGGRCRALRSSAQPVSPAVSGMSSTCRQLLLSDVGDRQQEAWRSGRPGRARRSGCRRTARPASPTAARSAGARAEPGQAAGEPLRPAAPADPEADPDRVRRLVVQRGDGELVHPRGPVRRGATSSAA